MEIRYREDGFQIMRQRKTSKYVWTYGRAGNLILWNVYCQIGLSVLPVNIYKN